MNNEYVQQQNGIYRITGSRVSLDSIVYGSCSSESPETIRRSFLVLRFEEAYAAIAVDLALKKRLTLIHYLEQ